MLNGEAEWKVLVEGVANIPVKFISILELDSVECSSHADVNSADIIDWVNDVSLGLVLTELSPAFAFFIIIYQIIKEKVLEYIVRLGLEYRRLGCRC